MKNRKTLLTQVVDKSAEKSNDKLAVQANFNLLQVELLDENNVAIRITYEVEDADEEAIGRFGSLQEAENFIKMLCLLDEKDVEPESKK
ncbi:hypothetical protein [Colwellia ponticola]|uniref:Uncharacterized protein n=1 Tax=Colwellia ponticola TaxID=2304625 RepID=A0A8H2PMH8_9GAMM|nr:hypothetical protein [Colwellia ponticola]TMM46071.1 hypothetical protein FCS21_07090 [Colwellia ponticola]